MDDELDRRLAARVELQHGVFGRGLLTELGFTKRQIARRTADRRWLDLHPEVWRMAGAPVTWQGELLAACLAGPPLVGASHRSGAAVWDVPGADQRLQEIVCPRWERAQRPSLIVHESKALSAADLTIVDHIPVTTIERTLLDLGAVRHADTVERAVETALRRELTTIEALETIVHRLGRRGRRGAGVLRKILAVRTVDRDLTDSDKEMVLLQVLRRHGLPEPVVQYEIWHKGRFLGRVDAAYLEWRIALEYESYEFHIGRKALERDSSRRNDMVGAGWLPITMTYADVRSGGHVLARQIREARDLSVLA